ncbi:hypothetical protein scyTo_0012577, partial [Scyliorhinus torazame]|nr:hypothetical protein [Scyliorhinus torazame]
TQQSTNAESRIDPPEAKTPLRQATPSFQSPFYIN